MKFYSGTPVRVVLVVCLLAGVLFAQAQSPQSSSSAANPPNPGAPVNSTTPAAPRAPQMVPILISATDGSGNPVKGLTKEQLSIRDANQIVQPLKLYEDLPLHLGIVLVASHASFSQQQAAAIELAQKVLRPNVDEAFVISARGKKPWSSSRLDWVHNPTDLEAAIRALDSNAGLPDPFNFSLNTDEVGLGRMTIQTMGGNGVSVFDIVDTMMNSDPRPSRRVVVMFREPWAHSPGYGNRANTAIEGQLQRVIAAAQQTHVTTFCIGLEDPRFGRLHDTTIGKTYISQVAGGAGGTADYDARVREAQIRGYDAGKTNIQRLASDTGGETYWSVKKNFSDAVNAIANELAGEYIVTFTPSDAPGPVHSLKITSGSAAHLLAQSAFFYEVAR